MRQLVRVLCTAILVWIVTPLLHAQGQQSRWEELSARFNALYRGGNYAEALTIAEEARSAANDNEELATSESNLALTYQALGSYQKAEPLFLNAVDITEKTGGKDAAQLAPLLANLSGLYQVIGDYDKAEPFSKRALAIRERQLGPWHHDVANSLINLGLIYEAQGKYPEAESLLKRALEIFQRVVAPDDPEQGMALNDLGELYATWERYGEAESLLLGSLKIEQKAHENHPDVVYPVANLGSVYATEGKYSEADSLYRRAIEIEGKAVGWDHPVVATLYRALAQLDDTHSSTQDTFEHLAFGRSAPHVNPNPDETERILLGALQIYMKAYGEKDFHVAEAMVDLGHFYSRTGKYDRAEALFKSAGSIYLRNLGSAIPQVADLFSDFADLYSVEQKYPEAEEMYLKAKAVDEKILSSEAQKLTALRGKLANFYDSQRKYEQAAELFDRVIADRRKQFEYELNYMNGRSRLSFLEAAAQDFDQYFSFYFTRHLQDPQATSKMYDAALWQKEMAGRDVAAIRARIKSSHDPEALSLFGRATALKTRLAVLRNPPPNDLEKWQAEVRNLQTQIDGLDGELLRRLGTLGAGIRLQAATWRDVQQRLKADEAAVELLCFPYQTTFQYIALVLKGGSTSPPTLVPFAEEHSGEMSYALEDYWSLVAKVPKPGAGEALYRLVWRPLEPHVKGCRRIYLSPVGDLDAISFGLLPDENGRRVIEDHEIAMVSTTKDLLRPHDSSSARKAILLGDPLFDLSEMQQREALKKLTPGEYVVTTDSGLPLSSTLASDQPEVLHLKPLEGAREEMQLVQSLLENHGWDVKLYAESLAQVEVLRAVRGPRILHIATHGFFESFAQGVFEFLMKGQSPTLQKDPFLRAGLYFTGANRAPTGPAQSGDLHNGVFTSLEATALDLQGTELVVLSGCETGMGATTGGQAVFGFQRALQDAGAESVLTSMWSVPDDTTRELMTLFYEKLLGGEDKFDAIRDAQLVLRERVKKRWDGEDRPYYWGAFLLVGR